MGGNNAAWRTVGQRYRFVEWPVIVAQLDGLIPPARPVFSPLLSRYTFYNYPSVISEEIARLAAVSFPRTIDPPASPRPFQRGCAATKLSR